MGRTAALVHRVAALLSPAIGVPIRFGGVYIVALVTLLAVTRPIFFLVDRAIPRLLDEAASLVDLETVRQSAEPTAMATVLLAMLEDGRKVRRRWEIAHLWFERDVVEVTRTTRLLHLRREVGPGELGIPPLAKRASIAGRRSLLERTQTAINLAGGDQALFERLNQARTEPRKPPLGRPRRR